jgi:hypothetical protein
MTYYHLLDPTDVDRPESRSVHPDPTRTMVGEGSRSTTPCCPPTVSAGAEVVTLPSGPMLTSIVSLSTISSAFDPLFKVLFIFRSLYLFAIGLVPLFSFGSDLRPA